jgi:hypothetical protein
LCEFYEISFPWLCGISEEVVSGSMSTETFFKRLMAIHSDILIFNEFDHGKALANVRGICPPTIVMAKSPPVYLKAVAVYNTVPFHTS